MGSFKEPADWGPNRRLSQAALAASALVLRDDRQDFQSPNFRRFGLGPKMNRQGAVKATLSGMVMNEWTAW
jgi:hypothetical protein